MSLRLGGREEEARRFEELYTVTAAAPGRVCMAVVDHAERDPHDVWAERRWSGADITKVHCGRPATVDVGYPACDEHGAKTVGEQVGRQLLEATGVRWDACEVALREWEDHYRACDDGCTVRRSCTGGRELVRAMRRTGAVR